MKPLPDTPCNAVAAGRLALFVSVLLATAAQLFLKVGAATLPPVLSWREGLSVLHGLLSPWVWIGILFTLASLFAWLRALRSVPLGVAFNVAAFSQVLVPVCASLWLGEVIHSLRWLGIALVFLGVLVIAQPLMRAEVRQ